MEKDRVVTECNGWSGPDKRDECSTRRAHNPRKGLQWWIHVEAKSAREFSIKYAYKLMFDKNLEPND